MLLLLQDCAAVGKQAIHDNSMLMGCGVSLPIQNSLMLAWRQGRPVRTSLQLSSGNHASPSAGLFAVAAPGHLSDKQACKRMVVWVQKVCLPRS